MPDDKRTPLYEEHIKLNAKMVPFGGWEMPIQYKGILAESEHCRKSVSLFDTCHMGEFYFKGDISSSGIESAISFKIEKIPVGRCKYGLLMNEKGGVVDDLIVYRLTDDELMIVVNAATCENDFRYIGSFLNGDCRFENISEQTAKIDIQGPLSSDVIKKLFDADFDGMKYFGFEKTSYKNTPVLISRTGYTGELGYEIYCESAQASDIWRTLLSDERVQPAGLGARDILRLEIGLSLYGSDLDEETSPVEAGLSYFVDFDKDFVSSDILKKQAAEGTARHKIAFAADSRRTPRHGADIYISDKKIGTVTSGVFSPMLKKGIGLGYIENAHSTPDTPIKIVSGKAVIDAVIYELPFYKKGTARKK